MREFHGKYRGKVEDNRDLQRQGRLQVSVPAVYGEGRLAWALPCVPYAGPQVGWFALPPVGANIWVEFEGGDAEQPIWSGCFWGALEVLPAAAAAGPDRKTFQTDGISLQFDDSPGSGGVTLQVGDPIVQTPLTLTMNADGIKLSMAQFSVALTAEGVSINDGALEVR